jgi:hypothetical protein
MFVSIVVTDYLLKTSSGLTQQTIELATFHCCYVNVPSLAVGQLELYFMGKRALQRGTLAS